MLAWAPRGRDQKEVVECLQPFQIKRVERFVVGADERRDGEYEAYGGKDDERDGDDERPEQVLARLFDGRVDGVYFLFERGEFFFGHRSILL